MGSGGDGAQVATAATLGWPPTPLPADRRLDGGRTQRTNMPKPV